MFTLVILLQVCKHLIEECAPLVGKKVWRCVSIHDLLTALYNAIYVGILAAAVLPFDTANKAEFGSTVAPRQTSAEVTKMATW
jgi:hypothetical protein